MRVLSLLLLAAGVMFGSTASAGTWCTENLISVIAKDDGNYYFKSDKTCASTWCSVNWSSAEKNKNGFVVLLTAKVAERSVVFYWPALSECTQTNATYASPEAIEMQ